MSLYKGLDIVCPHLALKCLLNLKSRLRNLTRPLILLLLSAFIIVVKDC